MIFYLKIWGTAAAVAANDGNGGAGEQVDGAVRQAAVHVVWQFGSCFKAFRIFSLEQEPRNMIIVDILGVLI